MRYWKNNFTASIEFKFFNSWAIKNQRYSVFVEKRYPSYDVPRPSYDVPCPSYDGPPIHNMIDGVHHMIDLHYFIYSKIPFLPLETQICVFQVELLYKRYKIFHINFYLRLNQFITYSNVHKRNKIGHSSRSSSIQRSKTTEEVSGNVKQFWKI